MRSGIPFALAVAFAALTCRWWQYHEADTCDGRVEIRDAGAPEASLIIPDTGDPALTRYQRVVITFAP